MEGLETEVPRHGQQPTSHKPVTPHRVSPTTSQQCDTDVLGCCSTVSHSSIQGRASERLSCCQSQKNQATDVHRVLWYRVGLGFGK